MEHFCDCNLRLFGGRQQRGGQSRVLEDGASPTAALGSREVGGRDARDDRGSGGRRRNSGPRCGGGGRCYRREQASQSEHDAVAK